jgi:DUF1680 family protein
MENHTRYGEAIYFHTADALHVNQFIASEVNWRTKGLRIRQETDFPHSDQVRLVVACEKPVNATLKIRRPSWAGDGFTIKLNGNAVNISPVLQGYASLDRKWHDGDRVEVELPLRLRSEAMPDNPDRIAILYGPIVLAADFGPARDDRVVPVMVVGGRGSLLDKTPTVTMVALPEQRLMPVILANGRPAREWLTPVHDRQLVFRTTGVGRPKDLELMPLYEIHDRRYSVYLDLCSEKEWKAREPAHLVEQRRLRTVSLPTKP